MKTTRRAVAAQWLESASIDDIVEVLHELDPARLASILQRLASRKASHAQGVLNRAGKTIEDPAQLIGRVLGAILK